MSDLKPCPFCGGLASTDVEDNGVGVFWIVCNSVRDGCGCEGPYKSSPEEAASAWNRRSAALSTEEWTLVPIEPTDRMIAAGIIAYDGKCESSYRAMLAAAPLNASPEQGETE